MKKSTPRPKCASFGPVACHITGLSGPLPSARRNPSSLQVAQAHESWRTTNKFYFSFGVLSTWWWPWCYIWPFFLYMHCGRGRRGFHFIFLRSKTYMSISAIPPIKSSSSRSSKTLIASGISSRSPSISGSGCFFTRCETPPNPCVLRRYRDRFAPGFKFNSHHLPQIALR